MDLGFMDVDHVPHAHGILTGQDPFYWLSLESAHSDNGHALAMVLLCAYRATQVATKSEFGRFVSEMPHQEEDDHVSEGPCFKCVLKDLMLQSRLVPIRKLIGYFVRALNQWNYQSVDGSIFPKLHDSFEIWANQKGWLEQLY
ncbi:uncharacterized protein LOC119335389 [Triticum dicoccoides]|uniref:uncharacterized protein LOC119335389 n=1 Tax=Triticum dicoccoides TaxID=85692 RepID=UPI001891A7E9|nr:uncharacterized protein LOC119335389 [Triticum dicoccoides]